MSLYYDGQVPEVAIRNPINGRLYILSESETLTMMMDLEGWLAEIEEGRQELHDPIDLDYHDSVINTTRTILRKLGYTDRIGVTDEEDGDGR